MEPSEYVIRVVIYMRDNFHPPMDINPEKAVEFMIDESHRYYDQNLSDEMAGEFIAHSLKLTRRNKEN
jgi:hypothetical protein